MNKEYPVQFDLSKDSQAIPTVRNCARCGETHHNVLFTKFERHVTEIKTETESVWGWGVCENTHHPILLVVVRKGAWDEAK